MNFKDLTVKQFEEILKVQNNKSIDELDKAIIICQIIFPDVEFSLDMPYKDLLKYTSQLKFLGQEIKPEPISKKYTIGKYQVSINKNVGNITTSQYLDYTNFMKNGEQVKAICVYLIPDGCTYNKGYDFNDLVDEVYNKMNCIDYYNITFFLQSCWGKYIKTLLNSLIIKSGKMIVKESWKLAKQKVKQLFHPKKVN